jgi:hypothetical protein
MATNLCLDPKLIEQAVKVEGERTQKAAVNRAREALLPERLISPCLGAMGI